MNIALSYTEDNAMRIIEFSGEYKYWDNGLCFDFMQCRYVETVRNDCAYWQELTSRDGCIIA